MNGLNSSPNLDIVLDTFRKYPDFMTTLDKRYFENRSALIHYDNMMQGQIFEEDVAVPKAFLY